MNLGHVPKISNPDYRPIELGQSSIPAFAPECAQVFAQRLTDRFGVLPSTAGTIAALIVRGGAE